MKLSHFHAVDALVSRRRDLEANLASVAGEALGVTIRGRYQDDALIDAVRPIVRAELERRIASIDDELTTLGVDTAPA